MFKNITYIFFFKAIVYAYGDCSGCCDAEDRFEEGGGIGAEDADAFVGVGEEEVGEAAGAVGGFEV